MRENGSGSERSLQLFKRRTAIVGEVPNGVLACEASEGNGNGGIVLDEASVEVGEPRND